MAESYREPGVIRLLWSAFGGLSEIFRTYRSKQSRRPRDFPMAHRWPDLPREYARCRRASCAPVINCHPWLRLVLVRTVDHRTWNVVRDTCVFPSMETERSRAYSPGRRPSRGSWLNTSAARSEIARNSRGRVLIVTSPCVSRSAALDTAERGANTRAKRLRTSPFANERSFVGVVDAGRRGAEAAGAAPVPIRTGPTPGALGPTSIGR